MIKKLKRMAIGLAALAALVAPALLPLSVSAQTTTDNTCSGITDCLNNGACAVDDANCNNGDDAQTKVRDMIKKVINIFSLVIGVVAVIMIILGGFKYITSGGDSGNVTGAKNTILYAVIGLIIVALAQIIVRFVLQTATSQA